MYGTIMQRQLSLMLTFQILANTVKVNSVNRYETNCVIILY